MPPLNPGLLTRAHPRQPFRDGLIRRQALPRPIAPPPPSRLRPYRRVHGATNTRRRPIFTCSTARLQETTVISARSIFSHTNQPTKSVKMAAEKTANFEKQIKRNPHPDFKKVEASRPPFDPATTLTYTQTPDPDWKFGGGANSASTSTDPATGQDKKHIPIDPYAPNRPAGFNYKLLISAIIPRPIALLSTRSADGKVTNLAPFSYFQLIGHDPPLFVISFVSPLDSSRAKDSLRNLAETRECVINLISEDFVEAANATSINTPYGVSEWDVSGLTPAYDCETVGVARVKEAVFAIEGKLESVKEYESRANPGTVNTTLAVIEGTRFWAREDAVNEERNLIDTKVLRPIFRLGGITYSRVTEALELPRHDFEKDLGGLEGAKKLESKHQPN